MIGSQFRAAALFFALFALGRSIGIPQALLAATGVAKEVRRSCVSIEMMRKTDDPQSAEPMKLGSGIIVLKQGKNYCVTNLHVVQPVTTNDLLLVGLNMKHGKLYGISKIISTDPQRDIAILDMGPPLLAKGTTQLETVKQAGVGISNFADTAAYDEGTPIITIGFPLGIGTETAKNQPIVRSGIIAQTLQANGDFVIDGISSHGNSGSPIFSLRDGKLLGMIKSFPSDFITAYDENHQLVARLPYNSGLSIAVSSKLIWDLLP
jgi:hypothetical protein